MALVGYSSNYYGEALTRLRKEREKADLSLDTVAQKCGIATTTLARAERGFGCSPRVKKILCKFYGLTEYELFGSVGPHPQKKLTVHLDYESVNKLQTLMDYEPGGTTIDEILDDLIGNYYDLKRWHRCPSTCPCYTPPPDHDLTDEDVANHPDIVEARQRAERRKELASPHVLKD
jgi:transcriptional regulator with XRE-family HTH domain